MNKTTWVISGASSAIAREFGHLMASKGHPLILIARDAAELKIMAADYTLRYKIPCQTIVFDFSNDSRELCLQLFARQENLGLFLAHSLILENQELAYSDINLLTKVNITSTFEIIYGYLNKEQATHELIFLSSVAACRGRSKNSLYGASKAAVEVYLQGLQQSARPSQTLTIMRLGFIDTTQTFGKPGIFYASAPKDCARACYKAFSRKKRMSYHPFFWRYIMGVISNLPFIIYRRMKL
ncbi:oxidoreductase [Legionella birminghamensis]|uniref:Oxidoreductase n=1 Tax=Legionella birminghamensis TaxID=28083 RepID=A0A378IGE7_9GAMM|nr:SDR family NAD(P)-dependent oxidoreductase [Legionella birminghamensis]KTC68017.1 oxidoreductase [Legionella birminghamensis]STX31274.1 oxidoreductase [Legionella birminghamensis]